MIPGASGVTSIVTASILDGSTNAFLALRVGIITRDILISMRKKILRATAGQFCAKQQACSFP